MNRINSFRGEERDRPWLKSKPRGMQRDGLGSSHPDTTREQVEQGAVVEGALVDGRISLPLPARLPIQRFTLPPNTTTRVPHATAE